jgi:biotin carboxylase
MVSSSPLEDRPPSTSVSSSRRWESSNVSVSRFLGLKSGRSRSLRIVISSARLSRVRFVPSPSVFTAQNLPQRLPPEIGIPAAHSVAVSTVKDALTAAADIGYPVILRSAFSLGGLGSGFAENEDELRDLSAKSLSLSPQVLIEKSLKGWKELEYEVVRDAADNVIICCNMEVSWALGLGEKGGRH